MKDIAILGCGGFAKEVLFLIEDINANRQEYNFLGFVDYDPQSESITVAGESYKVFKESDFLTHHQDCLVAMGVGDPKLLKKLGDKFSAFQFPNLIHPNFVGHARGIQYGRGNIITAGCIFTTDIVIDSFNIFNLNTTLGHDSIIASCNVFNPGCNISGGVNIGTGNLFGTNSVILQYVECGDNSVLGAGAVLNKALESNKVAVGIPAKVIKDNL